MKRTFPQAIANTLYALVMAIPLASCVMAPGLREPIIDDADKNNVLEQIKVSSIRDILSKAPGERERQTHQDRFKDEVRQTYKVGIHDVLNITVWNHPQLMQGSANATGFLIQSDGSFFFPYAGKISAAGKSLDDIRAQLTQRLKSVVKTPQVSVTVKSYGSQKVYILGAIEKPGLLPLQGYPVTVMGAIALSGGLTEQASMRRAYILRNGQRIEIKMLDLLKGGDVTQDLTLKNGDILHIPDNRDEKVYVLGAVTQPKSVTMTNGELSLSEALMGGGGMNPQSANTKNVYVIRNIEGKAKIFHLDMEYADAFLVGEQFSMEPRDVIYVASARITRWNRVLNQILPTIRTLFYLDALTK